MEHGLTGITGAHVSVITVLEQEHGTELDLVQTPHHHVLEGKIPDNKSSVKMEHQKIAEWIKRKSNGNIINLV